MAPPALHLPVLLAEALEALQVKRGGLYADGTLGLGGHARAVLDASAPDGRLLAVDRDAEALALAREGLAAYGERLETAHARFDALPELLGARRVDGLLLDLGVSSLQLDSAERGFSLKQDGPLDMRMDRSGGASAEELVNRASERELCDAIHFLGEEPRARAVARAIVEARRRSRIRSTGELAAIVRRVTRGRPGLDAATRTFQALRIRVNRELEGLAQILARLAACLAPNGRFVVISFHSLEDREVKTAFRELHGHGFTVLTKKPVTAGPAELRENPRARSAKLRALARVDPPAKRDRDRRGSTQAAGDREGHRVVAGSSTRGTRSVTPFVQREAA
ncbi:MAG: 16S rRNA (cytosine(1402)-N(4))-methyltransferase RsmH [Vicinamibacteria bacterium]